LSAARTLHITNGDSAAGTMNEARIIGDILPWRDVLHDGPVPGGLSLPQLSPVRARFLSEVGWDDEAQLLHAFKARDDVVLRYEEYEGVVLWFEWDLYDQLQLLQLLDFFADRLGTRETPLRLELVSLAGYLGNLQPEKFHDLYARRQPVNVAMLSLGKKAWRAVTSSDPRDVVRILEGDTSPLPFLEGALNRFLEELPWSSDGLSRAERQLVEGIAGGASKFSDVFQYATGREERIYCGDASAALYLQRLAGGVSPLVSFQSNGQALKDADLSVTDAGRSVLAEDKDWIELGGSDRWLGGVHLEGANAKWRWDAANSAVMEARAS
jgi:hypothetical protein